MSPETPRPLLSRVIDSERPDADSEPPYDYPAYESTALRAPRKPLLLLPHALADIHGPAFGDGAVEELDSDLTRQHTGEPLGERIIVSGRVLESDGRPSRTR